MGTRGLMGVRVDGQDKLTYNHWDSYPSGLGNDVIGSIREGLEKYGLEGLKDVARKVELIDGNSKPTEEQIRELSKYGDTGVSEQTLEDWYCLLRDLQGHLLCTLEAGVMIDSHDFINDSLFCEWAYILNLDEEVLEIYRGFRDRRHSLGRYAPKSRQKGMYTDTFKDKAYYPCALVEEIPLDELPDDLSALEARIRENEDRAERREEKRKKVKQ